MAQFNRTAANTNVDTIQNRRQSGRTARRLGDTRDVAQLIKCSPRSVYRYADQGRMPKGVKVGGLRRWDLDEIEEWLSNGCPRCPRRSSKNTAA